MRKSLKVTLAVFCLFFWLGVGAAETDGYPRYMGVDCSAEGHKGLAFNYVDEYCSHIVCEEPGFCVSYGYYVYDVPALNYQGVQIVTDTYNSTLLLRADGQAISWGNHTGMLEDRADIRRQLKSEVKAVHGSDHAFAVLKNDGKVITWGYGETAEVDSESLVSKIVADLDSGVVQLFSDSAGFVALTRNGSVVSWHGGIDKKNKWGKGHKVPGLRAQEVVDVHMNIGSLGVWTKNGLQNESHRAWAALKRDGSVVVWGDAASGGKIEAKRQGLQNVVKLYSTHSAFAALKSDGTVAVWGNPDAGGSLGNNLVLEDVKDIYSTDSAFAALKNDGTVVAWGDSRRGGEPGGLAPLLQNIVEIVSTNDGFAARNEDDIALSWGEGLQYPYPAAPVHTKVKKLLANTAGAFAALKEDGSVVTWGNPIVGADSSSVVSELESGVVDVYAAYGSFAALKEDGSVVSWGDNVDWDGVYSRMRDIGHLSSKDETDPKRIKSIVSSPRRDGFFVIRNDGSAVSWGQVAYPYHASFYDILDDPLWSRILPDMDYVWYFELQPLKRIRPSPNP